MRPGTGISQTFSPYPFLFFFDPARYLCFRNHCNSGFLNVLYLRDSRCEKILQIKLKTLPGRIQTCVSLSFLLVGFAVTAQVDGDQHLSRIFVSDVLPHGLAYGEGPCGPGCLCSPLIQNCDNVVWLAKCSPYSFVRKWFLSEC